MQEGAGNASHTSPQHVAAPAVESVVHVWIVPLDSARLRSTPRREWLSAEEWRRCRQRRGAAARMRYVISRAVLRRVLGDYLSRPAETLEFVRGERGKPAVVGSAQVDFSFSDCRDAAVIAVAARAVGIDAEHERELRRGERTIRRIFHPETAALLQRLPPHRRASVFLDAWTQREAHVKAVGGGLFHTPDSLPFDPAVAADARLHAVTDRQDGEEWSIARFEPVRGARASLVVRSPVHALHVHPAEASLALLEEMR